MYLGKYFIPILLINELRTPLPRPPPVIHLIARGRPPTPGIATEFTTRPEDVLEQQNTMQGPRRNTTELTKQATAETNAIIPTESAANGEYDKVDVGSTGNIIDEISSNAVPRTVKYTQPFSTDIKLDNNNNNNESVMNVTSPSETKQTSISAAEIPNMERNEVTEDKTNVMSTGEYNIEFTNPIRRESKTTSTDNVYVENQTQTFGKELTNTTPQELETIGSYIHNVTSEIPTVPSESEEFTSSILEAPKNSENAMNETTTNASIGEDTANFSQEPLAADRIKNTRPTGNNSSSESTSFVTRALETVTNENNSNRTNVSTIEELHSSTSEATETVASESNEMPAVTVGTAESNSSTPGVTETGASENKINETFSNTPAPEESPNFTNEASETVASESNEMPPITVDTAESNSSTPGITETGASENKINETFSNTPTPEESPNFTNEALKNVITESNKNQTQYGIPGNAELNSSASREPESVTRDSELYRTLLKTPFMDASFSFTPKASEIITTEMKRNENLFVTSGSAESSISTPSELVTSESEINGMLSNTSTIEELTSFTPQASENLVTENKRNETSYATSANEEPNSSVPDVSEVVTNESKINGTLSNTSVIDEISSISSSGARSNSTAPSVLEANENKVNGMSSNNSAGEAFFSSTPETYEISSTESKTNETPSLSSGGAESNNSTPSVLEAVTNESKMNRTLSNSSVTKVLPSSIPETSESVSTENKINEISSTSSGSAESSSSAPIVSETVANQIKMYRALHNTIAFETFPTSILETYEPVTAESVINKTPSISSGIAEPKNSNPKASETNEILSSTPSTKESPISTLEASDIDATESKRKETLSATSNSTESKTVKSKVNDRWSKTSAIDDSPISIPEPLDLNVTGSKRNETTPTPSGSEESKAVTSKSRVNGTLSNNSAIEKFLSSTTEASESNATTENKRNETPSANSSITQSDNFSPDISTAVSKSKINGRLFTTSSIEKSPVTTPEA